MSNDFPLCFSYIDIFEKRHADRFKKAFPPMHQGCCGRTRRLVWKGIVHIKNEHLYLGNHCRTLIVEEICYFESQFLNLGGSFMGEIKNNGHHLYEQKPQVYFTGANPFILQKIKQNACNILDIGCAEGNLGAAIRNNGSKVYGIELFPGAAREAEKKLNHVLCGDIETVDLPYEQDFFDHIIFGDVLEHLHDPWAVLRKVKPYLKRDGSIIACIPNVGHISIIHGLISGNWTYVDLGLLDKTHYRFFTWNEIVKMFHSSGYQISDVVKIYYSNDHYNDFIAHIEMVRSRFKIANHNFSDEAKVFQYVVEAKKQ